MYMICKDFDLEEFEPWGETAINTKEKIVFNRHFPSI